MAVGGLQPWRGGPAPGAGAGGGAARPVVGSGGGGGGGGGAAGGGEAAVDLEAVPLKPNAAFKLDDFELLATLGTGTFGRVRLVRQTATGKYYALKIMKKTEVCARARRQRVRPGGGSGARRARRYCA